MRASRAFLRRGHAGSGRSVQGENRRAGRGRVRPRAAARAAGDPVAFDRGVAEGQAWTIDQAVDAGLASAADPGTDSG